jgi:hypothetical protein
MKDIYFVHDAGDGRLIVLTIPDTGDIEEAVMQAAEGNGMHWGDCSWGGVSSIGITV